MDCARWNDSLIGRLYDEISPEDDAALEQHLAECAGCRATREEFGRVRAVLAEDEPAVPRLPRVVVLNSPARWRTASIAATILGAALLAGTGAGAGYALGARRSAEQPVAPVALTALDASTESLVRDEVAKRFAALVAAEPKPSPASASGKPALTAQELKAELARFERKLNDMRAVDLDYLLTQIEASEVRTGTRIGKTNDALRTVALASNPYLGSQ